MSDRARLHIVGAWRPVVGVLVDHRADTLTVRDGGGYTQRVLVGRLTQVERSSGRPLGRSVRHDALWGAVIGSGILTLGGAHRLRGAEIIGAVGTWAAMGAVVGVVRRPERWRPAVLAPDSNTRPHTAVAPSAIGARWALTDPSVTPPALRLSPLLHPRDAVRLETTSHGQVLGTVVEATVDSLWVDRAGVLVALAQQDVRSADVYLGRTIRGGARRGGLVGAPVGAIAGGLAGLLLAALGADRPHPNYGGAAMSMGAVGSVTGYFIGSSVGRGYPADEWRRLVPDSRR